MSFRIGMFLIAAASLFVLTIDVARAADCPLSVSSVNLEGQGLAGHVDKYRVILIGTSATTASAVTISISVRGIATPLSAKVDGLAFTGEDGKYWSAVTFLRPSDDVTGVALLSAKSPKSDVVNCASAPVAVGGRGTDEDQLDFASVVETFDDTAARLPTGLDAASGMTREATFDSRTEPEYPILARDAGIQGTAIVGVRIAAEGAPQFVWVDRTSGDKSLDSAAIAAASSSRFRQPLLDGRPVTTTYLIVYEFRLDESIGNAEITKGRPCDAWTGMLSLEAAIPGTAVRWYDGSVNSIGTALADITFVMNGASGPRNVTWSHIPSDFTSRSGDASTGVVVYWPDAVASSISVSSVRRAGSSKGYSCPDNPSYIDNTVRDDTLVATNPSINAQITAPEIEITRPARFASLAWPKYSSADTGNDGPNAVVVEVRTSDSGEPIAAYVQDTQYSPRFSKAALNAAMASNYVVPLAPDGSVLTHTFSISYFYEPK